MDSDSNKVLKAGTGYTVGNILIRGIGFLTLPLFSRILSTEQFGIYNIFLSYDAFLFVIIGLALHSSIRSANLKFAGKINEYTSSISLIYIINLGLCFIVVTVFGRALSTFTGFDRVILYLLIMYSFGSASINLYNDRISLEYAYRRYLAVSLVNTLGSIGLSFLFMFTLFRNYMVMGRILGVTLMILSVAVTLILSFYRKARPKINWEYWKFGLTYSLPIVPHGISQVLLAQIDRIMIQRFDGNSAAGIYSLAGNIRLIMTVITTSISTAWSTWFYEQMNQNRIKNIQLRAKQVTMLFAILAIGLIALSPELIRFLGGPEYMDGRYVAVPMIIDAFILFIYNVVAPSEYYMNKTTYIMAGTMVAAGIDVVANYFFIQRFGYIAAAYTTLFAYVCYLIFHLIISKRLIHARVLPLRNMLLYVTLVVVMGVFTLVFADSIAVRYVVCAVIVIPCGIYLLRAYRKTSEVEEVEEAEKE